MPNSTSPTSSWAAEMHKTPPADFILAGEGSRRLQEQASSSPRRWQVPASTGPAGWVGGLVRWMRGSEVVAAARQQGRDGMGMALGWSSCWSATRRTVLDRPPRRRLKGPLDLQVCDRTGGVCRGVKPSSLCVCVHLGGWGSAVYWVPASVIGGTHCPRIILFWRAAVAATHRWPGGSVLRTEVACCMTHLPVPRPH